LKIDRTDFFLQKGEFSISPEFSDIMKEIKHGIKLVTWHEKDRFVINPLRRGNGVTPIKNNFIHHLSSSGWLPERSMALARGMNPGPIDAIKSTRHGIFAVEWETGNISSSHRALNKIAVGILQKQIIGGILILPIKKLSQYLTDRIGNYEELAPYFPLYKALQISEGIIGVIGVDFDDTSFDAPTIPKGKDGNAEKTSNENSIF
jgi:hypothetical protein